MVSELRSRMETLDKEERNEKYHHHFRKLCADATSIVHTKVWNEMRKRLAGERSSKFVVFAEVGEPGEFPDRVQCLNDALAAVGMSMQDYQTMVDMEDADSGNVCASMNASALYTDLMELQPPDDFVGVHQILLKSFTLWV